MRIADRGRSASPMPPNHFPPVREPPRPRGGLFTPPRPRSGFPNSPISPRGTPPLRPPDADFSPISPFSRTPRSFLAAFASRMRLGRRSRKATLRLTTYCCSHVSQDPDNPLPHRPAAQCGPVMRRIWIRRTGIATWVGTVIALLSFPLFLVTLPNPARLALLADSRPRSDYIFCPRLRYR